MKPLPRRTSAAKTPPSRKKRPVEDDLPSAPKEITPERKQFEQQLLKSLDISVPQKRPSVLYLLALVLVACGMILVPLAYLGLLALLVHAIYWHVQYIRLTGAQAAPALGKDVGLAILIIVACGVTLFFLIKPWFAWRSEKFKARHLKRDVEPFLFAYVDALCEAVGAPKPRLIRVDCVPNASASLRRGVFSLMGSDLVLTIGLPFISGLTLRQLTGVLAHEFGHFSQTAGMRLNVLIRTVNMWMFWIIYQRDAVDNWLEEMASRLSGQVGAVVWCVAFVVRLSRRLLFGITWLAEFVASHFSRQMEFDADRYEYGLVGSRTFAKTSRRLPELSLAYYRTLDELSRHLNEGRLSDDIAALVAVESKRITPEIRKKLSKFVREQEHGWFDSHPSDHERMARANSVPTDGCIQLSDEHGKLPASVLFRHYAALCRAVTLEFYRNALGDDFDAHVVCPAKEVVQRTEEEIQAGDALDRYFQTHIPLLRPLPLGTDAAQAPDDPKQTLAELKRSREDMRRAVAQYERLAPHYETAEDALLTISQALALLDYGLKFSPQQFSLKRARESEAKERHKRAKQSVQELAGRMLPFETEAATRLTSALQLAFVPKVAERLTDARTLQHEIKRLVPAACFVSRQIALLLPSRVFLRRLWVLLEHIDRNRNNPELGVAIEEQLEKLHRQLSKLQTEFSDEFYPLDHANAAMTLREFLLPAIPDAMDIGNLIGVANNVGEGLLILQLRLFGRLAVAAEKVETAIGLPPLPARASDKKAGAG